MMQVVARKYLAWQWPGMGEEEEPFATVPKDVREALAARGAVLDKNGDLMLQCLVGTIRVRSGEWLIKEGLHGVSTLADAEFRSLFHPIGRRATS